MCVLARDEVTSFPIRMQLCAAQSARVQPNSGLRVCLYVSASPSFHSFRIQSKGQLITQSTGVCVCVCASAIKRNGDGASVVGGTA